MTARQAEAPRKPWYREPWPWFLMAGPGLVVVAAIATAVIAFRGAWSRATSPSAASCASCRARFA
jgi:hypothetical protein